VKAKVGGETSCLHLKTCLQKGMEMDGDDEGKKLIILLGWYIISASVQIKMGSVSKKTGRVLFQTASEQIYLSVYKNIQLCMYSRTVV